MEKKIIIIVISVIFLFSLSIFLIDNFKKTGDAKSILNREKALDYKDPFKNLNEKETEVYFNCLNEYGEKNKIDRSEGYSFLEKIISTRNSKETEDFNEYMKNCIYLNGENKTVLFKGNNQIDLVYLEQDRFLGTLIASVLGTFLVVGIIDITSQYCCLHEACWCCLWYYNCPQEW